MADRVISRAEARAQGLKRFFTGKECRDGHLAERQVCDGCCCVCTAEYHRKRRAADPESERKRRRQWKKNNPEKVRLNWERYKQAKRNRRYAAFIGPRKPTTGPYADDVPAKTRKEAIARGLTRFATGEPCVRGHIAERYTKSGECLDCRQLLKSNVAAVKEEIARRIRNADLLRQARADGRATYSTGEPCRHGHLGDRRSLDSKCVECVRIRAAKQGKRWRKNNPEKRKESTSKWRANNLAKFRDSTRASRERNKHKYKAAQREYQNKNKEKINERVRERYLENREYYIERSAAAGRKRRAIKKGASGTHTIADAKAILAAQGCRCAYCAADLRKVKKHLDHIIPLVRGGSDDKANLQYLCARCNLSKGAKDPIAFAWEQGRLL